MPTESNARKLEDEANRWISEWEQARMNPDEGLARAGTSMEEIFFPIAAEYLEELEGKRTAVDKADTVNSIIRTIGKAGLDTDQGLKKLGRTRWELYFGVGASFIEEMERKNINADTKANSFSAALRNFEKGKVDPDQALGFLGMNRAWIYWGIGVAYLEEMNKAPTAELKMTKAGHALKAFNNSGFGIDQSLKILDKSREKIYLDIGSLFLKEMERESRLEEILKKPRPDEKLKKVWSAFAAFKEGGLEPDQALGLLETTRRKIFVDIGASFLKKMDKEYGADEKERAADSAYAAFEEGRIECGQALKELGRTRQEIAWKIGAAYIKKIDGLITPEGRQGAFDIATAVLRGDGIDPDDASELLGVKKADILSGIPHPYEGDPHVPIPKSRAIIIYQANNN